MQNCDPNCGKDLITFDAMEKCLILCQILSLSACTIKINS